MHCLLLRNATIDASCAVSHLCSKMTSIFISEKSGSDRFGSIASSYTWNNGRRTDIVGREAFRDASTNPHQAA